MTLLTVSLVFLVAAAVGGPFLARHHLRRTRPPQALAVVHPLLAASAALLLAAGYVRADGANLLALALGLVVVAGMGGMVLAALRVNRGAAPTPLVVLHAALGLAAIALVAYELLAGDPSVPPPLPGGPSA